MNAFPAIANKYILSQFQCGWQQNEIEIIRKGINNTAQEIHNECTVSSTVGPHFVSAWAHRFCFNFQQNSFRLISLRYEDSELNSKLVSEGIGAYISSSAQISSLMRMISESASCPKSPNSQIIEIMRSSKYNPGRNLVPTRPLQSTLPNRTPVQLIQSHLAPPKPSRAPQLSVDDACSATVSRLSLGSTPVFIANDLPIGSHHLVYCSYVEDGPKLFSVQLKNTESTLDRIMNDLPNIPLKNLTSKPTIGMACIARYSEDKALYRAAIMNIQHNVCRVTFIDYGNSEDVPHAEIYEIPDKYLQHKTLSIQFTLYDCKQLEPIDANLKIYFEKLISNEVLELKVMPIDGPMYVQYCELYLNNRSVLELLKIKQQSLKSFPIARRLVDSDVVIIRYVNSVKQFYVQRTVDIPKFDEMMDRLLVHCHQSSPFAKMPKVGDCCAAMLHDDNNEWYRVRVLETLDQYRVVVQFVDFGFVAECKLHQLKPISMEFIQLPRQVIECCLVDFESIDEIPATTNKQLEMLAEDPNNERRQLRVSLRDRMPDNIFLVNLFDESTQPTLNVSSSLCKLLMPRKHYGGKNPPKSQSSSDCTSSTISADTTTNCSANTSGDPKWEGTTQSTPAHAGGQYAKRGLSMAPNQLNWNASTESSIRLGKSREGDGSETRSTFIEEAEPKRNANRMTNGNSKSTENGGGDRRGNSRNSNNWRNDDNNGHDNNR